MNIVLKSVLVSQYENESKRRRTFNGISLQWGTVSAPGPLISQCQWSTPNQFISAVCRVDEKPPGNQWQRFRSDPVSCPPWSYGCITSKTLTVIWLTGLIVVPLIDRFLIHTIFRKGGQNEASHICVRQWNQWRSDHLKRPLKNIWFQTHHQRRVCVSVAAHRRTFYG